MRIYDTVIVTCPADLDMLEARFREFQDMNTVHVIAESVAAYDGAAKDVHFMDSRSRFAAWEGRWNHIKVEADELPEGDPLERKNALREYLLHGVTGEPDDIVLHGGVEEIPSASLLPELEQAILPVTFEMRQCIWRPHILHPDLWRGTVAATRSKVRSLTDLHGSKHDLPMLKNGGTRIVLPGGEVQSRYEDGRMVQETEVDDTWPRYIAGGHHPASWRTCELENPPR